jgi:hypothetical protein
MTKSPKYSCFRYGLAATDRYVKLANQRLPDEILRAYTSAAATSQFARGIYLGSRLVNFVQL